MHTRKVTKEGRVNIPVELMRLFDIKEEDSVTVTHDLKGIRILKQADQHRCAITGELSDKLYKVGEAYISKEGLEILEKGRRIKS
ncbi:AbrB/MazE/SpoVT family DNA-binding domain-containing protein [Terribacillus saccharophilus]|uniref:AbrB/MazE/SpoVT family DNA-binding domain-containing protein n=1 Tax=Terribacillus saccharophilus TaxID=361277 RepID=UPI002989C55C|nr:AbrB/MazE/SpoVT family DNA-binding domain-containing protein [Terribacillus saccharophilus]MCM3227554.1 AbrB/MazE/SpoVT family DNA-binding domain-containing protein [Terribacillus saccharophilus]